MDRRSLLIDSAQLVELTLDGPALRVRAEGKSRQWFPLRRLSLVSCIELPATGMDALATTAREGIPVTFYGRGGKLLAQLIHPGNLPGSFSHWVEAMAHDEELQRVYDIWLENQLRHSCGLMGCMVRDSSLALVRAEAQLRSLAKVRRCEGLLSGARDWVEGLLTGLLQGQAMGMGLSANSSQLAKITADLMPVGKLLGLTWLVADKRRELPGPAELPYFCGKHLAPPMEQWVARLLGTLANQLENCAMAQTVPLEARH